MKNVHHCLGWQSLCAVRTHVALCVPMIVMLACDSSSPSNPPSDAGDIDTLQDVDAIAPLLCSWAPDAEELPFASGKVEGVLTGDSRNRSTKCTQQGGSGGPEKIYRFEVPVRRRVTLETVSTMNTVVAIRRACEDPLTEVACGAAPQSQQGPSTDAPLFFSPGGMVPGPAFDAGVAFATVGNPLDGGVSRVLEPGLYFVIIDQEEAFGVGGSFTLKVTVEDAPPVGSCESPRLLGGAEQFVERLDLATAAPRCSPVPLTQARFYKVTIPAGHILSAQAIGSFTPGGLLTQPFLQLSGSCDDTQCLAADAVDPLGGGRKLKYVNNTNADMTAILSVGSDDVSRDDISFTLNVRIRKPNVNGTCRSAVPVKDGTVLDNQTFEDGVETAPPMCNTFGASSLFYSATLLPEQTITALVSQTPGSPFTFNGAFLIASCGSNQCLGSQFSQNITYKNTSADVMNVILGVSGHGKFDPRQPGGSFSLRIQMPDPPGVITTEVLPNLQVRETGEKVTFKIKLSAPPTSAVTIPVASSDPAEAVVSPATVSFTPQLWDQPVVVTVTGVNDATADGPKKVNIVLGAAVSGDPRFSGKDLDDVVVINQDDEPGVSSSVNMIFTTESGLATSVPLRLNNRPSADVTVQVKTTNPTEATATPTTLTFTPTTWDVEQIVTVKGVQDNVEDAEQSFELVIGDSTSADPSWVAVPALRLPGKNRTFAFAERSPTIISGARNCNIGFSQWDTRIAVDKGGRLYIGLVCDANAPSFDGDGGVSFRQSIFVVTSDDGGKTFTAPFPIDIDNVSNLALAGGPVNTAYLVGSTDSGGVLLRTVDGGLSWAKVPSYASTESGFNRVVALGQSVVVSQEKGNRALLSHNASLGQGAFVDLPNISGFSQFALLADPNGVDIWQIVTGTNKASSRSKDGGATFTAVGNPIIKPVFSPESFAVGGNVLWAATSQGGLLRYDFDTEKELRPITSEVGAFGTRTLIGDASGGVTMFDRGFDGSLSARHFNRMGVEAFKRKVLDSSGQPSATFLAEKTVGYTYASGNTQKFGILVWP